VSTALVPVSFALTGPLAHWIGPTATMAGAGLVAAAVTAAFALVPGVRDPERGAPAGGPGGAGAEKLGSSGA